MERFRVCKQELESTVFFSRTILESSAVEASESRRMKNCHFLPPRFGRGVTLKTKTTIIIIATLSNPNQMIIEPQNIFKWLHSLSQSLALHPNCEQEIYDSKESITNSIHVTRDLLPRLYIMDVLFESWHIFHRFFVCWWELSTNTRKNSDNSGRNSESLGISGGRAREEMGKIKILCWCFVGNFSRCNSTYRAEEKIEISPISSFIAFRSDLLIHLYWLLHKLRRAATLNRTLKHECIAGISNDGKSGRKKEEHREKTNKTVWWRTCTWCRSIR